MNRIFCPVEFKFSGDPLAGDLEGYGSVFGGIDCYGDSVAPGAFTQTLAEHRARGQMPPMLMQHGAAMGGDPRPVGVWTSIQEDAAGLKVSGRLVALDTETGRYNLALVRDGAMRGLSIGYKTIKADYPKTPGGPRRVLKQVALSEISIVHQPADAAANVLSLKAALDNMTVQEWRELETHLRDADGLSRNDAVKAVSRLKDWLQRDAVDDPTPRDEADAELAELFRRNIATLNARNFGYGKGRS